MDSNTISHILVNGFPRSGNTFLTNLLNQAFDIEVIFIHHRADYLSVPNCIVPIRKPEESIPSWAKFSESDDIYSIIRWYERFYTSILDNINNVTIVAFEDFTTQPLLAIDYLSNKFNIKAKHPDVSTLETNANAGSYNILNNEQLNKCKDLFNQVYKKKAII